MSDFPDWTLISGIFAALQQFEEQCEWDMSVGENAHYAEVLYNRLSIGFPKTKEDIQEMFKTAHVFTYRNESEYEEATVKEMEILLFCVLDHFIDSSKQNYVERIKMVLGLI